MYNYYLGTPNPTSGAMPSQSTNNNGNVAGLYYSDSVNTGLSQTASYNYDAVNRLTSASASGSSN
jgi:hypothetical protein